ncbi:MAG: DUF1285 domain-containing protein [Bradymonadales bacterium]|nr:DUF1285 domain-containing protein [Bradymonadales bacterium]
MDPDLLQQIQDDPDIPESIRLALRQGTALEPIRLDRHGRWWFQDEPLSHPRIVALFQRSIDRTPAGTFVLAVGRSVYPIAVEDTPLFVTRLSLDQPAGRITLHLSDGSEEPLDPASLQYDGGDRLVARIKEGRLEARFLRAAYHALMSQVEPAPDGYRLRLGSRDWPLAFQPTGSDTSVDPRG